jgi:2-phosphoglycerate kinase
MARSADERPWDVVLVGGASGVGKTRLGRELAGLFGMSLAQVDDFQTLLERMTTPEQLPALHFWSTHPDPGSLSAHDIHTQGLEILEVMRPGLEAVIDDHLEDQAPVLLEGDFIHPALLSPEQLAARGWAGRVGGLFVIEPEAEQIVRNFLAREPNSGRQDLRADVGAVRSRWLEAECERIGVRTITARPWDTLRSRALQALVP